MKLIMYVPLLKTRWHATLNHWCNKLPTLSLHMRTRTRTHTHIHSHTQLTRTQLTHTHTHTHTHTLHKHACVHTTHTRTLHTHARAHYTHTHYTHTHTTRTHTLTSVSLSCLNIFSKASNMTRHNSCTSCCCHATMNKHRCQHYIAMVFFARALHKQPLEPHSSTYMEALQINQDTVDSAIEHYYIYQMDSYYAIYYVIFCNVCHFSSMLSPQGCTDMASSDNNCLSLLRKHVIR